MSKLKSIQQRTERRIVLKYISWGMEVRSAIEHMQQKVKDDRLRASASIEDRDPRFTYDGKPLFQ